MVWEFQIAQSVSQEDGGHLSIVLIVFYILFLLAIVLALPSILRQSRLASRARRDHQRARGTQHLRQIRDSLKVLNRRRDSLDQERQRLRGTLGRLEQERTNKLASALCRHIVETQLTQIDGIGPKLRDRLIRSSFDGTLRSLRSAYRVSGVGQQKQWAIERWVEYKEQELPHLMTQDFPNKTTITDEYDRQERELRKNLQEIEERVESMSRLASLATAEAERLSEVTVAHFRRAYAQDREASEAVGKYLQGAFPEWAPMPSWFKTLLSEYGG